MINIEKKQCTGCTACQNICPVNSIEMLKDLEGFLYPSINDEKCIRCNLCNTICPANKELNLEIKTKAYGVINRDGQIRSESSSGGFFSIIAEYILHKKGFVYGAAYDENFKVKHICVEHIERLSLLRGAKYVQSDLGEIFSEIKYKLEQGKEVLFVGTPCQVVGLKTFLNKEYKTLLCVDLICHGVPSPKIWDNYVHYRSKNRRIDTINMRSKKTGWSHYGYSTEFKYSDGSEESSISGEDYFMKAFVNDLCLRPSCYECDFKGIERISDFTLGDFWGVWDEVPEMDDNKGTSLIFVHSEKANNIFKRLEKEFVYQEVNIERCIASNPSMVRGVTRPEMREVFMSNVDDRNFASLVQKCLQKETEENIEDNFISKIKRKIWGK